MDAKILFLFLVPYAMAYGEPTFIQKLIGMGKFQIGITYNNNDCYLNLYDNSWVFEDEWKTTQFQCGRTRGSEFAIESVENNRYRIKTANGTDLLYWYWLGQEGDVKPLQFRPDRPRGANEFSIREMEDGKFSFAAFVGETECPLYWKYERGATEFPAEFRCFSKTKADTFWIKGDCIAKKVQIKTTERKLNSETKQVIGISTAGSCSKNNHNTLTLQKEHGVTEEFSIELSKSKELNWERSASVSVSASSEVMGIGVESEVQTTSTYGQSQTFGYSETKSSSTTDSNGSSFQANFNTPGAAMVIGYVKRYEIDNSKVPVTVTAECTNDYEFTYDTTVRLKSKLFSITNYRHATAEFKKDQCDRKYIDCMENITYDRFSDIDAALNEFDKCFPPELLVEKKKKKKIGKDKSSSKSENKDSKKSTDKKQTAKQQ